MHYIYTMATVQYNFNYMQMYNTSELHNLSLAYIQHDDFYLGFAQNAKDMHRK